MHSIKQLPGNCLNCLINTLNKIPLNQYDFVLLESNLGTMVINESSENTMKQYGTVPGQGAYRHVSS